MADQQAASRDLADRLGVSVTEGQWQALEEFWALLLVWNARINLTGARSLAELVGEHLPDSLAMARLVPSGARVLDVGSGGGLPAIPFALLRPDAAITLVEPRTKRAAFLRTALRQAKVQADVLVERVEALAAPRAAEVASSRATFRPAEWLARARALAPRALVFAAHAEVGGAPGFTLESELAYATAGDHPRWLGLFRST